MPGAVSIIPVHGIPDVKPGDDVSALIITALRAQGESLQHGDIVVVSQKIVSKAEGRLVDPRTVEPSALALAYAADSGKPAGEVEVCLREARRVVRMAPQALVLETKHGLVCANAGVDRSNVDAEYALLLPEDPDASAERMRAALSTEFDSNIPVIISDTFGRPWRMGQTNVAIGVAGMSPFNDYRGQVDSFGREMKATQLAVADELASAAELVQNKVDRVPVAIIRGYRYVAGEGRAAELVRPPEKDLFR